MAGEFNLFHSFGGTPACRRLSAAFYARVQRDPLLRPLFPGTTLRCAIEEFAAFLTQFLGGPADDAQFRWWLSLRESHLRVKIGPRERAAWMNNMRAALGDAAIEEPVRSALQVFFERSSRYLVNSGPPDRAAEHPSEFHGNPAQSEIDRRWEGQRALDEAVAAIRTGDTDRAIALAESSAVQAYSRASFSNLLVLMSASRLDALRDYVRQKLTSDPALAQERYAGRTVLHGASAAGDLTTVELLLRLGADPNAIDGGGHTPLYSLGNECLEGGGVVHVLIRGGARVDAHDGVKHCTALHMAARRGNLEVAAALLDCGANIEARDSVGDTPLRRAVNCGKTAVAALLLSRGADPHSKGSRGLTPVLAARTAAMRQLLQSRGSTK